MTREEKLKKIVADPVLWCRYFVRIVDKTGKKVRFEPTYHQKLLVKNFGKYNIVAKARQLGVTSVSYTHLKLYRYVEWYNPCIPFRSDVGRYKQ